MATLDRVIEMQKRGTPDNEIARQLSQEGISPLEINNSLNQANVKNAVVDGNFMQDSQASIMPNPQETTEEIQPQENLPQGDWENQASKEFSNQSQEEYYSQTPQAYGGQEYYPAEQQNNLSTETISEIAEQVVQEKFSEFTKKTGDLVSFRNAVQDKITDLSERLKRIENTIDKLQSAIIGRIGEFGESTSMIHQDLENLHGTVSKLVNPLVDNYNELKKIASRT